MMISISVRIPADFAGGNFKAVLRYEKSSADVDYGWRELIAIASQLDYLGRDLFVYLAKLSPLNML
jgi:hypothetical protein